MNCVSRWRSDIILGYFSTRPDGTFTLTDQHGCTLLHYIAMRGNAKLMEILLAKGVNIEAKDSFNRTPLLIAASHKNEEIVDALLNVGADITSSNDARESMLVSATLSGCFSMVQHVIEALKAVTDDIFAPST